MIAVVGFDQLGNLLELPALEIACWSSCLKSSVIKFYLGLQFGTINSK